MCMCKQTFGLPIFHPFPYYYSSLCTLVISLIQKILVDMMMLFLLNIKQVQCKWSLGRRACPLVMTPHVATSGPGHNVEHWSNSQWWG